MSDRENWRDLTLLPPEVRRYIEASRQASMDERQMMIRFAPVLCRCIPWYDYEDPRPPQEDCLVHTTIMFDPKGEWL